MYLARFEVGTDELVQAAAAIEPGGARNGHSSARWDLIAGQLAAAARIPGATVAHRISLDARRRLRQMVAITANATYERDVRAVLGRLTRLERMRGAAVSLPPAAAQRDAWMEDLGALRLRATPEGFSVAGVPVACAFRVADVLDVLLTDACIAGHAVAYQVHVRGIDVPPDAVRAARKNMLALRDMPGVPAALVEWQDGLARALGYASALCEEYLVTDDPESARSIEQLLADRFHARYAPLGFPAPELRFERNAYPDALTIGVHSHDLDPLAPVSLCSVAESAEGRDRLLGWRPAPQLERLIAMPLVDDGSDADEAMPAVHASLPTPDEGGEGGAFVSYKRQDIGRVAPLIRLLQERRVPVWYDRGIPGGAEWDEVIEEQLSRARFVLVCTSQAAIESKYVRREVKFADALNVPILPVLLEDVAFAHGMGMLLTQYQMLDTRHADFAERLRIAVARVAAGVHAV